MGVFDLTKGISKRNNDRQGGLRKILLFDYVEFRRSDIRFSSNGNTIIQMPNALAFQYDMRVSSFTETQSRNAGGEVFEQSLTFDVQGVQQTQELWKLTKAPTHAIVEDMQGNYRFIGLYNGVDSLVNIKSGANVSDMGGYSVTMSGSEDREAPYVSEAIIAKTLTIVNGQPDGCGLTTN